MKQFLRRVAVVLALSLAASLAYSSGPLLGPNYSSGGGAGGGVAPPPRHAPNLQRVGSANLMPMVNMHNPMIGRGVSPYYKVP